METNDLIFDREIRRQFAALGYPVADISAQTYKMENGQPVRLPNGKYETITRQLWYDADVEKVLYPEFVKEMRKYNCQGHNIYMKPRETNDLIYILVDDLHGPILEMFTPNLLLRTSLEHKKQAVYAVPFVHDREDTPKREARRLYMDVFTYLNLCYGDSGIHGFRHAFRVPGFSNRKPDYAPNFPYAKLLSARKATDPRMVDFIDRCAAGKFPLLSEIRRMKDELKETGQVTVIDNPEQQDDPALPEGGASLPAGGSRIHAVSETDHRPDDMKLAWEMAKAGATEQEIREALSQGSAHLASPCGYDLSPDRYIARTAERVIAAFEKKAVLATRKPAPPVPPRPNNRPTLATYAKMARRKRDAALAKA